MEADFGEKEKSRWRAAVNNLMMQFQSDLFGSKMTKTLETTALGAYLAGLAVGYWKV
jgi:glycerol kinase